MAKKNFSDPDDLINSLDDLNAPQARKQRGTGRARPRTRKAFRDEPDISSRDIAVATGDKSMAGQYKRKQILIPPDQLDYIRDKAFELQISQAELFRWLIDYGLMALEEGVLPEVEVVQVRGETVKIHWTSQQ